MMRHIFYMLLLLFLFTNCAFSKRKSQKYFDKALLAAPYDAIIIPGVPHDGVSWSPTMNIRVSCANFLFKKGIANNIIFSGGAVYTKYSEAKILQNNLIFFYLGKLVANTVHLISKRNDQLTGINRSLLMIIGAD